MTNLEYGDFHKFKASLGVGLIVLAGVFPWLFLREPFDLYIEQSKLQQITPIAKSVIENRQSALAGVIKILPFLSLFIFTCGILILFFTLKKWSTKQDVQDKVEKLNYKTLEAQSEKLSQQEILEKSRVNLKEVGETASSEMRILNSKDKGVQFFNSPNLDKYVQIETALLDQINKTSSQSFQVLGQCRVAGREFDAVMARKSGTSPDILIEIKYFTKIPSKDVYYRNRDRLVSMTIDYVRETGRNAKGLLIVVVKDDEIVEGIKRAWVKHIEDLKKGSLLIPMLIFKEDQLGKLNFENLIAGDQRLN